MCCTKLLVAERPAVEANRGGPALGLGPGQELPEETHTTWGLRPAGTVPSGARCRQGVRPQRTSSVSQPGGCGLPHPPPTCHHRAPRPPPPCVRHCPGREAPSPSPASSEWEKSVSLSLPFPGVGGRGSDSDMFGGGHSSARCGWVCVWGAGQPVCPWPAVRMGVGWGCWGPRRPGAPLCFRSFLSLKGLPPHPDHPDQHL